MSRARTGTMAPDPQRTGTRPTGTRPTGTSTAIDVVVLGGAVLLALLPLAPVYGMSAVAAPAVGGVLLGALVAVVAAARGWGVLVTIAVALVVYLLAGGALAAPTTTLAGVVPTPATLMLLLTGAISVWKQVLTLDPSLGGSGNLLVAPYLLGLAATLGAVGLARRSGRGAAWAAVVPVVVLLVTVLLGTKEAVSPVVAGVLLVLLLLPWAAARRATLAPRRVVSLVLMAAVVVAGGAAGGPVLGQDRPRFVLRDELVPPFDPRDHPSPLSAFRAYVKEWKDDELVTVRGLPEGTPVRLATMDAFDGVVWNVAGSEQAEGSGRFRRVGETIATTARGTRAEVEVQVHRLPSVWLPTVGYAERVDFSGGEAVEHASDLRYNDATGTAVLTEGVPAEVRYTVEVVVPDVPDDEDIDAARIGPVRLPEPRAVPEAVPLFAGELAGTATSPVLIARTLEQGLAERGFFSHGLVEAGDEPSLSGHGADRVTTLLTGELMVGDGEQYASAMALMAREMGLPARVVMGFLPPDGAADAGEEITFTGDDVDAWVEISFAGHGWVPFFPTPDEAKTPREDTPEDQSEPEPQVVQPPPPPADPVRPPDDDTEQASTDSPPEEEITEEPWRRWALVAAAVGLPLVLLLTPFVLVAAAKSRRRRRRRAAGEPVQRVVGGWDELLDHARDLRRPAPERATRRETAVHLAQMFATDAKGRPLVDSRRRTSVGGPVAGLAAGADAIVFGPGQPSPEQVDSYWSQVEAARRAMDAAVPVRHRLRARWSTASLRARRRVSGRTAPRRAARPGGRGRG